MTALSTNPVAFAAPRKADVTAARPPWGAVYAMTLCVFVLIASEFMPVSLLTPIAEEFGLTEGQAGQAISLSGLFAVATSLVVTTVTGRLDRRLVLVTMALLLALSGTLVALAPSFLVLMVGRAILGVAIGGFWSLQISVLMRLLPAALVPLGLAICNGGIAVASTVSAPLGSAMGDLVGWRWTFFAVVPLALAAAAWQAWSLPPLPAGAPRRGGVLRLLKRGPVLAGMFAVLLLFVGQFSLFTFLRPFLEQVTGVGVPTLSTLLLVVGVASLVGGLLIGRIVATTLALTLVAVPLAMAAVALALAVFGTSVTAVAVLLAAWGLVSAAAPVAWGTWLSRALPDDAEAGGGLIVATMQLAITLGAVAGGLVFDAYGPVASVAVSAAVLVAAALAALLVARTLLRRP